MTKLGSNWTLVPFVEGKDNYGYPTYTWDYGTFVLTANSFVGSLHTITISDPQTSKELYRFGVDCNISIYQLSQRECVNLLSGIKEVVENTLRSIHKDLLCETSRVDKIIKLLDPE